MTTSHPTVTKATAEPKRAPSAAGTRQPFTPAQLEQLFASPLFTGARSATCLHLAGGHLENGWVFWLPLSMLLMGVRPNELGRAMVGDVALARGWPCLWIGRTADRAWLRAPDKRLLPLPRELLRLGFLGLVGERYASGETKLFPDWSAGGDTHTTVSRRFNGARGYLQRIGMAGQPLGALRHSHRDALRRSGVPLQERNVLMGIRGASVDTLYRPPGTGIGFTTVATGLDLGGLDLSRIPARYTTRRHN